MSVSRPDPERPQVVRITLKQDIHERLLTESELPDSSIDYMIEQGMLRVLREDLAVLRGHGKGGDA